MTRLINGCVARDSPVDPEGIVSSNFVMNAMGLRYARLLAARDERAGTLDSIGVRLTEPDGTPVTVPRGVVALAAKHGVPLVLLAWIWDITAEVELLAPGGRRLNWLPAQVYVATDEGDSIWFDWEPTPDVDPDELPEEAVRLSTEEVEDLLLEIQGGSAARLAVTAVCDDSVGYVVMLDAELCQAVLAYNAELVVNVRPSERVADHAYETWDHLGIHPAVE